MECFSCFKEAFSQFCSYNTNINILFLDVIYQHMSFSSSSVPLILANNYGAAILITLISAKQRRGLHWMEPCVPLERWEVVSIYWIWWKNRHKNLSVIIVLSEPSCKIRIRIRNSWEFPSWNIWNKIHAKMPTPDFLKVSWIVVGQTFWKISR